MSVTVGRSLQDAQVTRDPVGLPGSPQSYPCMTPSCWGTTCTASSYGVIGNNCNGTASIIWRTLNGLRLISFGPVEKDEGPLIQAIQNGDARKVRDIVMSVMTPKNLMGPNKDGWNPVHEAAYYGQNDCLKILLAATPFMINTKTLENQTPLILAVSRGHLACTQYLLKKGADPRIPTKSNETPLYEACTTCNVQMVLLLLQHGANVNQKYLDGWTVLHEAVSKNCLEICEILVDYGAMLCSPNPYGMSPLFLAAQAGNLEVLKFLVRNGADINSEAKDGATALYEASKNGHTHTVEFLLSQGADADRPGKDGLLPLHVAVRGGNDRIVSMLIPTTSSAKTQQSGISPLHLAAEYDEDDVLELLIQAGFDVNAVLAPNRSCMYEDRRITAVYFAVDNGNIEAATMLLEAGADLNLDPFNPLLLAVRKDDVEMATLLMGHGANLNASIPIHPTIFPASLMLSVRNLTMLKCVMDHGGDATACFQCKYGFNQHPNIDFTYGSCELQYRPQMPTHSGLQFCEVISHPMVSCWAGPIIDLLLDYVGHVKLCSRLRELLESNDSWVHIKDKSALPKCLQQLCRLRIRQLLGTEGLKCITSLALPRRLIDFLRHEQQKELI